VVSRLKKEVGATISRVLSWVVIYLGVALPLHSSEVWVLSKQRVRLIPYTSCCEQGLPGYPCYHKYRWALTPPFHCDFLLEHKQSFCSIHLTKATPKGRETPWS